MSIKGIRFFSTTSAITWSHWARERSTPVGLWQQGCSSTMLLAGRLLRQSIMASNCTPPVAAS
ncbi:hypothetical protein D3C74_498950 [compost metagenome]